MKRRFFTLFALVFTLVAPVSLFAQDPYIDFAGSYGDVLAKVKGIDGMRIVFEQADAVISARTGSIILKCVFAGGKVTEIVSARGHEDKPSADKTFAAYKGVIVGKGVALSEDTPAKVVGTAGGNTYTLEIISPEENTFEVRLKLKYAN